jgi:hypothetical protein
MSVGLAGTEASQVAEAGRRRGSSSAPAPAMSFRTPGLGFTDVLVTPSFAVVQLLSSIMVETVLARNRTDSKTVTQFGS